MLHSYNTKFVADQDCMIVILDVCAKEFYSYHICFRTVITKDKFMASSTTKKLSV